MTQFVLPRQVESVAALRALTKHRDKAHAFIRPDRSLFIFDEDEVAADDGVAVIKPSDVSGAGRYVRYSDSFGFGLVNVRTYGAVGDDATDDTAAFQAASVAAVAAGKDVFVPGDGIFRIAGTVTLPNADQNWRFGPGSIVRKVTAGVLFSGPSGLAQRRYWNFYNPTLRGGLIADQDVIKLNDVNSYGKPCFFDGDIRDFECLANAAAGQTTFNEQVEMRWSNCYLPPPNMATPKMLKSKATGWGTTDYDIIAQFHNCLLAVDLLNSTDGWTFDFEGDLEFNSTWALALKGASRSFSFCGHGQLSLFGIGMGPTLETFGTSAWNAGMHINIDMRDGLFWTWNGRGEHGGAIYKISITNGARLIVDDPGLTIGSVNSLGSLGDIAVDIKEGADDVVIFDGHFGDHATTAIRTAAKHGRFNCQFASTGAHATFVETGTADDNWLVGCQGLGTGAGPTILGASSRIDPENARDIITFGGDPTEVADSAAAFEKALASLPSWGGVVRVDGKFRVDTQLDLPDKDVTFEFTPGSRININAEVISLFNAPDGLTETRKYCFKNPTLVGGSEAEQTAFKLSDDESRAKLYVFEAKITGFNRVLHAASGQAAYVDPVEAWFCDCVITPPDVATNELLKSSTGAGNYPFGITVRMTNCVCDDINNPTRGWTNDFDGDLIADGCRIAVKGANIIDGFDCGGKPTYLTGMGSGGDSLEVLGASYWGLGQAKNLALPNSVLKLSSNGYTADSIAMAAANTGIILNADRLRLHGIVCSGVVPAIYVDALAGADNCSVQGAFLDATTAAVRTAAQRLTVTASTFESTAAHKTVADTGGGGKTLVTGCNGVGTGGGTGLTGVGSLLGADNIA